MFALQYAEFGPPQVLSVQDAPEPHAGPGEVRIRVISAGVSPVDAVLRSGSTPAAARLALPHVPGVDAAGVVDEVGPGVLGTTVGDEVFGAVDVARLGGASAEFAVLRFWAARPAAMNWDEAGSAGTGVETATRALDRLGVEPADDGRTLLVDGASGGVGSLVVQLAVARGARVLGTVRAGNEAFVAGLGAEPILYGSGLPERVGRVDLALDVAGAGSLPELIALTGSPEAVLTLADFSGPGLGVALSMGSLAGEAGGEHGLPVAAALAREGRFRVAVQAVFDLGKASDAHDFVTGSQSRRGKTVLRVS
jgi:NADPH:quinone reductase-like Zn-dependent oxidoreductase